MNVFPKFYEAMAQYENKLEINCFFIVNKDQTKRVMNYLEDNYSFLANFYLQENTNLPNINLNEELWFTDVYALANKNVLVLNPNLLPTQNDTILAFLKVD